MRFRIKNSVPAVLTVILGAALTTAALADPVTDRADDIARTWAQVHYRVPAAQKLGAMTKLKTQADALAQAAPNRAEALAWDGIVTSSLAGLKGGIGGLSLAKDSRTMLERASKLDNGTAGAMAHTSLGALYYQVPGWPIGFGSKDKARSELLTGLKITPRDIDANYFWGDFLFAQGQYADAAKALRTALAAPARPGREIADAGRRGDVQQLLAKVNAKLGA